MTGIKVRERNAKDKIATQKRQHNFNESMNGIGNSFGATATNAIIRDPENGQVLTFEDGAWVNGVASGYVNTNSTLQGTGQASSPLGLAPSGVTPGSYSNMTVYIDQYGRTTTAISGLTPLTSVATNATFTGQGTTGSPLGVATVGTPGTYAYPTSVTTNSTGQATAITAGTAPSNTVTTSGPVIGTGTSGSPVTLGATGTAGTYAYPTSVTTNSTGQVTSITAGSAPTPPAGGTVSVATNSTYISGNGLTATPLSIPSFRTITDCAFLGGSQSVTSATATMYLR